MAHQTYYQDFTGSTTSCPAPMTRVQLITLRNSNLLNPECEYVVTDFSQNRVPVGTTLHFKATTSNSLSEVVDVKTAYDNEAWFGIYDIDTNLLKELRDGRGNVVRDVNGTAVGNFDWGNTAYTNCLVDNASWAVTYGSPRQMRNVEVKNSASLNTSAMAAGSLTNFVIENSSSANFQVSSINATNWHILNSSTVNLINYSGNTSNSNFTIKNNSSLNLSNSSSAFSVNNLTLIDASTFNHTGVSSGIVSGSRLTMTNGSSITHGSGALALNFNNANITDSSSISHTTGTISNLTSVLLENNSSILQNSLSGSLSMVVVKLINNSVVSNQSASNISIDNSILENASRIDKRNGATGTALISYGKLQNNSNIDLTATSANSFSMVASSLTERASLSKSGTGTLNINSTRFSTTSRLAHSALGNLSISNGSFDNFVQINHAVTTAGFTDSLFECFGSTRSQWNINGTRTGNNLLRWVEAHGLNAQISVSGTTSNQNINRLIANNGTFNMTNQPVAFGLISNIEVSSVATFTISNNTVSKSLNGIRVASGGAVNITGCTAVGSISLIDVNSGSIYTATGPMVNADGITVTARGRYTQNGGSSSNVFKSMSSTLTSGNFTHSNIGHHTGTSKTLTANNTNRTDHMGLAAQLV